VWNLHTYTFPHFYRRPFAYIPVPVWDPVRPILTRSSRERVLESSGLEFLLRKPAKNPRTHRWFTSDTWTSKSSSNISVASDTEWLNWLNIYIFKILHRNILRFTNETAIKNENVQWLNIPLPKKVSGQILKKSINKSHLLLFKKS